MRTWFRLTSETCRAAWINGRNDVAQANDIEQTTQLYARRAEPPPDDSLYGLGLLLQVYGPLEDGFFLQLLNPTQSPDPTYMFGWHILNGPPGFPLGFLYPRAPTAGARDPRVGGAIAGAPGRGFPCDPDPSRPDTVPDCTMLPDGIYLREFGADATPRSPGLRLFDPLGAGGRVAVGVDVNGWALVLAIRGDGSTLGRGGLAYRRNGEWVWTFDPLQGDSPPPCWLAGLAGFDLRIAANGNGYAAIPTDEADRHCDRAMDLYTVGGVACGSVALGTAEESCTGHVTLGPQGSVLRLLEGPSFEAGHPTCELRTWPGLLGPSP